MRIYNSLFSSSTVRALDLEEIENSIAQMEAEFQELRLDENKTQLTKKRMQSMPFELQELEEKLQTGAKEAIRVIQIMQKLKKVKAHIPPEFLATEVETNAAE